MMKCLSNLRMLFRITISDFKYNQKHLSIKQAGGAESDFASLRIYCHMLDKALNNPHFECGHSLKIYKAAIELRDSLKTIYAEDQSYKWTCKILKKFKEAQKKGIPILNSQEHRKYNPDEMYFIDQFILSRTSCRNFIKREIPIEILKKMVLIGTDAPTGCCRQSTHFYITQDSSKIAKLIPSVAGITNFTNIQCLVAICAESSFYNLIDKNLQYVDASLAAENFILAGRVYNIYGTMCNFFHATQSDIRKTKEILKIKSSENIVMFIAMGYPAAIPEKPIRRNTDTFYTII